MARIGLSKHRKFRALVRALGSPVIARGSLELVWDAGYETLDPVVGAVPDVEELAYWKGRKGALGAALIEAGFLDAREDGLLELHDFWGNAPDYVLKRAKRQRLGPYATPNGGQTAAERPPNGGQTATELNDIETTPAPNGVPGRDGTGQDGKIEDQDPGLAAGGPPTGEGAAGETAPGTVVPIRMRPPDVHDGRIVSRVVTDLLARQHWEDQADLKEAVKSTCARTGLAYDADVVRRAIDAGQAIHARGQPNGRRQGSGFTRVGA